MTSEGLGRLAAADVPKLGSRVAGTRDEDVLVGTKGQTGEGHQTDPLGLPERRVDLPHHITGVVAELDHTDPSLDVPEHAGHVT